MKRERYWSLHNQVIHLNRETDQMREGRKKFLKIHWSHFTLTLVVSRWGSLNRNRQGPWTSFFKTDRRENMLRFGHECASWSKNGATKFKKLWVSRQRKTKNKNEFLPINRNNPMKLNRVIFCSISHNEEVTLLSSSTCSDTIIISRANTISLREK